MDDFVWIAITVFCIFIAIATCMFCVFGCLVYHRKRNQAIYSTPVVITDQSFTPYNQAAAHPMNVQTNVQSSFQPYQPNMNTQMTQFPQQSTVQHQNIQMPMPYDNNNINNNNNNSFVPSQSQSNQAPSAPSQSSSNQHEHDLPPSYFKIDKS